MNLKDPDLPHDAIDLTKLLHRLIRGDDEEITLRAIRRKLSKMNNDEMGQLVYVPRIKGGAWETPIQWLLQEQDAEIAKRDAEIEALKAKLEKASKAAERWAAKAQAVSKSAERLARSLSK